MAKHTGLPKATKRSISKIEIINSLFTIDSNKASRKNILELENQFRTKIETHILSLPHLNSKFRDFNTSPFVLLIYSKKRQFSKISELELDIMPAKEFSSMETSAGKMVEKVTLPFYGWSIVESGMHTQNSALDGIVKKGNKVFCATLKSGPRCLNDEMSENFADSILSHSPSWAQPYKVSELDFTYGVLYGTEKQSNKKDWHILRNINEKIKPKSKIILSAQDSWSTVVDNKNLKLTSTIRIGRDWWNFLGGQNCLYEVLIAMIRACIAPTNTDSLGHEYQISDINEIIAYTESHGFNISLLQKSQIPWLFLMLHHFYDEFA